MRLLLPIAMLVLIVWAYHRFRGVPIKKSFASAAFGLVACAGAWLLVEWADDDASRLVALLVVMVGVAIFALLQTRKPRADRHPSVAKQQDPTQFL